jgi:ubiquinone/menaquinone biosynthesis C-methylase UbiE
MIFRKRPKMILSEIYVSVFCAVLVMVFAVGLMRVEFPRKASFQGIDDPGAAEAYDRLSRMPQFRLIRRYFIWKLKRYTVKGTVVDVGCGPGYLLRIMAKEWPESKLTGVDISKEMVEKAKANFHWLGLDGRVDFKEGSSEHLPFDDRTQDFLVSTGSLHHWADPELAFDEIHRVLKPGGQMLIFDLRRDAIRMIYWLLWSVQNVALRVIGLDALRGVNEPLGSLLASYTSPEIRQIMSRTNFSDWKIEGKPGWVLVWGRRNLHSNQHVAL